MSNQGPQPQNPVLQDLVLQDLVRQDLVLQDPQSALPRARITLRSAEFRRTREPSWRLLDDIVARIEKKGVSSLSSDELQQLPTLYRAAASSLSVARSIALDRNLVLYLENLVLRAFFVVYGPRAGVGQTFLRFLRRGFPAAVRSALPHIAVAAVTVLAGALIGFMLVASQESWFSVLTSSAMAAGRGSASTAEQLRDQEIFAPWPGVTESFFVLANFLFRHNATIGIMIFGLGIVGGAPTLLLLAYQGLEIGAYVALHYNRGLLIDFLGWISIHGVTEIGALILSGAGGLVVAEKILFPGPYGRLENLAAHRDVAAGLAGGAVLMLFVAGLIEGGLRQLIGNTPARFSIGLATGALWFLYFRLNRGGPAHDPKA